jgi:hypothetical protein
MIFQEELRDLFSELMPNLPRFNIEEVAQVENTAILDEGLLAIVPQLREAGLKVGIVTNNGFWSNQRQRTVMLSGGFKNILIRYMKAQICIHFPHFHLQMFPSSIWSLSRANLD